MQQHLRVGGDVFENAPRVDADIFHVDKKDAFSNIPGYAWIRSKSFYFMKGCSENLKDFVLLNKILVQKLKVSIEGNTSWQSFLQPALA